MKKDLCKPSASPGRLGGLSSTHEWLVLSTVSVGLGWVSLRRCGRGRVLVTGVQMGIMSKLLSTGFLLKITVLHLCIKLF